jgi:Protein of unknown function (DUF2844)
MIANRPLDAPNRREFRQSGRMPLWLAWTVIAAVLPLLAANARPASAGLGADAASVPSDASSLGAAHSWSRPRGMQIKAATEPSAIQSYVLHTSGGERYNYEEFVAADGDRVREFVAPDGTVFGVAWQGRRTPELKILLGSYFYGWHDAAANEPHHSLHQSTIQTSSLVVQMAGAMGFVAGRAWVPRLAPAGVDAESVVK